MNRVTTVRTVAATATAVAVVSVIWPLRIILHAHRPTTVHRDARTLIIPGTAQYDGRPGAQFAARLDRAAGLWHANPSLRVVTVGGRLPGDRYTEAGVGAEYLRNAGVDAAAITEFPVGNDTRGSLAAVAEGHGEPGETIIVTDPNHCLRAASIAREVGFRSVTTVPASGTPTRFPGRHWVWTLLHESAGLVVADLRRVPGSAGLADMLEGTLRTVAGRLRPSRSTRYRHLGRDRA
ncbi:YdcF family protein [Corynebacterium pygosceleis]|uniref:YdcF family protein n=1 Tax=Corynebacterium pygosceleis TaxID=2800406 RepID=UPI001906A5AF|nr:YdcF family protein [Corynebacterium pygosceleis]MCK7675122.1 YdcF family protein [Corynebacterium pygosceleis]MCL0120676.1 YdcF family protein [Corynebacterium pygosceleis]